MSIKNTGRRGRPPKVAPEVMAAEAEVEQVVAEPLEVNTSGVKLVVRAISINNQFNPDGSMPLMAVEEYINSYLNSGYKLMQVQFIRTHTAPDSPQPMAIELLFVLYKE